MRCGGGGDEWRTVWLIRPCSTMNMLVLISPSAISSTPIAAVIGSIFWMRAFIKPDSTRAKSGILRRESMMRDITAS